MDSISNNKSLGNGGRNKELYETFCDDFKDFL